MVTTQLFIGCFMIILTVIIQAVALDRVLTVIEKIAPASYRIFHKSWKALVMAVTVLLVFLVQIIQIWLWALLYLYLAPHNISDLETALYFSGTSFTTLGIGDIYLDKEWRLLCSFEAANGFMLFGWSAAFIFEIISKLYRNEKIKNN